MSKYKFKFFTIVDFEDEEKWLQSQHKKGLKYVKNVIPGLYKFEECEKEDMIYKLDYNPDEQNEDYFLMYKDYGWEHVISYLGWNYFRKKNSLDMKENDKEIFSNIEDKFNMIEHIYKRDMVLLGIIFFLVIIPHMFNLMKSPLNLSNMILGIIFIILFIIYLYIFIHCSLKLNKLKRNQDKPTK